MNNVTSINWHQQRGLALDAIDEAIAEYDGYMLDDDYDAQGCLNRIIKRLREKRALIQPSPAGDLQE